MFDNIGDFNPKKYLCKDLINKSPPMHVWLQGTIESVENDFLIISDNTGSVKVVKYQSAHGLIDKIRKGAYCCILGHLTKTKGLHEVEAVKFIDLSSCEPQMKNAWEAEVREAELVLEGKLELNFKQDL